MRIRVEYSSGIPNEELEVADVDAFVAERWGHIFHLNDKGGKIVVLEDAPSPVVEETPAPIPKTAKPKSRTKDTE